MAKQTAQTKIGAHIENVNITNTSAANADNRQDGGAARAEWHTCGIGYGSALVLAAFVVVRRYV